MPPARAGDPLRLEWLETEQALLGAILNDSSALDGVVGLVDPGDFLEDVHRTFFEILCARRDAGETITPELLRMELGNLDLGGLSVPEYIRRLASSATTVIGAPDYARIIRKAANRRRMTAAIETLSEALRNGAPALDPIPAAKAAIAELDGIVNSAAPDSQRCIDIGQAAQEAIDLARAVRDGRATVGVPYGLRSLDKITLGLVPGELVVGGGRPGMGKTTFASAIALNVALRGIAVGVFSMEMHGIPLAQRILATLCYESRERSLPYNAIARATGLEDEDLWRLEDAQRRLVGLPLWIEQQRGLTVAQIAARARQMASRAHREGRKLGLLVVDHLGLIQPSTRYSGNRTQEVTETTRALKVLAGELETTVLLLSQLNRGLEGRAAPERRPTMQDFRDSGSIEQDADVMFGLFREAYYLENKQNKTYEDTLELDRIRNVLEVEILKQRMGPQTRVKLFCAIECNVISELYG